MAATIDSLSDWQLPDQKEEPLKNDRVVAVGSAREDTRRASRVLLKVMMENYKAGEQRNSFVAGGREDDDEGLTSSSEDEQEGDLVNQKSLENIDEIVPPAGRSASGKKLPSDRLKVNDEKTLNRRLSIGVFANLEEIERCLIFTFSIVEIFILALFIHYFYHSNLSLLFV